MKRKVIGSHGGARPGAGRKPLPVGERRERLVLLLKREDLSLLARLAAASGKSTTAYARAVLEEHLLRAARLRRSRGQRAPRDRSR